MNVKIEKQAELPETWGKRRSPVTSALMKLEVGDAVSIDGTTPTQQASVRALASHYSKKLGCNFRSKAEGQSIKVWRLS